MNNLDAEMKFNNQSNSIVKAKKILMVENYILPEF